MPHLYILGLRDKTHYCGITRNITKRIIQHNVGMNKSTRYKRPIVLKYLQEYSSMFEARIQERKIKSQGVSRWLYKNIGVTQPTANSQQPTANSQYI
jgi:putative endonuclease